MGMNMIITLIMGITMSTIIGTAIGPSVIEGIKITKVENQTINNQEVIFEAIKRYTTMKQVAPTSIQDLIDAGYIDAKVNDNGFDNVFGEDEKYTISVDKAKGVATITTTLVDPKAQEAFLNSFKGVSKPSCTGNIVNGVCETNKFETKYVIPNDIMHGNALLMTGIPIGSTEPDSNIHKYWYDTKDGKAILKLYDNDNSKWTEVNLGMGNSSEDNLYFIAGDLLMYEYTLTSPTNTYITRDEKLLFEIIPSKLGGFNIQCSSCYDHSSHGTIMFVYKNGKKLFTITNNNKITIFFEAGDKIEFKLINSHYPSLELRIYVAPGSAGPSYYKTTKFTH